MDPDDPGTDPGTDPMDPGTDPMDPGTDPMDPGTDPMDPGTDPPMMEDLGMGDGMDVVTIGDSFMKLNALSGTEISLERVSMRNYRNYAVPGTQVLTGQIPSQWTQAKNANPNISTVIMTGGGNDVILNISRLLSCQGASTEAELSASCKNSLMQISEGVVQLTDMMGAAGVKDIVYIGYGYVTNNNLRGTIEWTRNRQKTTCNGTVTASGARCHFVDPAEQLVGKISADGIHPTNAGYDIIGQMVWDLMQERGLRR
jgi:lysophospholipase L1-like esterase